MTRSGTWLASAAVIALTIGVTSRADVPTEKEFPLPADSIIVAAQDGAAGIGQTEETAEDSAKMGKEEGTHKGAQLGATPENDTDKIDQPARRNPTTSNISGDDNGTADSGN
jgi:hypothetical protein